MRTMRIMPPTIPGKDQTNLVLLLMAIREREKGYGY